MQWQHGRAGDKRYQSVSSTQLRELSDMIIKREDIDAHTYDNVSFSSGIHV